MSGSRAQLAEAKMRTAGQFYLYYYAAFTYWRSLTWLCLCCQTGFPQHTSSSAVLPKRIYGRLPCMTAYPWSLDRAKGVELGWEDASPFWVTHVTPCRCSKVIIFCAALLGGGTAAWHFTLIELRIMWTGQGANQALEDAPRLVEWLLKEGLYKFRCIFI